jgi:hypothetical protein
MKSPQKDPSTSSYKEEESLNRSTNETMSEQTSDSERSAESQDPLLNSSSSALEKSEASLSNSKNLDKPPSRKPSSTKVINEQPPPNDVNETDNNTNESTNALELDEIEIPTESNIEQNDDEAPHQKDGTEVGNENSSQTQIEIV